MGRSGVFFLGVVELLPCLHCAFWFSPLEDTSKSHSHLGCRRWVAIFFQPKMKTQDPFASQYGLFTIPKKKGIYRKLPSLSRTFEGICFFSSRCQHISLEPWTLKVIFHRGSQAKELKETGFSTGVGVNVKRWYKLGFVYIDIFWL